MAERSTDEPKRLQGTPQETKKPYVRPALRRLGSVRELTASGASMTPVDGLSRRPM